LHAHSGTSHEFYMLLRHDPLAAERVGLPEDDRAVGFVVLVKGNRGGANYILKPESKNKLSVASPMRARVMLRSVLHLPV
jgi:hypothetical protein